jgi:hypothetical protein
MTVNVNDHGVSPLSGAASIIRGPSLALRVAIVSIVAQLRMTDSGDTASTGFISRAAALQ